MGSMVHTQKIDPKKTIPSYAAARGRFDLITVPPMRYLAVDGSGDPNSAPAYRAALETLFPVAYRLKFRSKRELARDYVVLPLEALWWADDMATFTTARDKSAWHWTTMILVPEWIPDAFVDEVRAETTAPALDLLRVESLDEGLCVQTLHVGPYDDEGAVLQRLHDEVVPERGLRVTGRHHEIYLGDPRRTAPERLRTILRQPVARV